MMHRCHRNIAGALTLFIVTMCLLGCAHKNERLIGEWTGTDNKGESVSIIFDNTDHATVIIGNHVIGGNGEVLNGHPVELTYKTDDKVIPHLVEFELQEKDTKKKGTILRGIYRLLSDNKMEMRVNFYGMASDFKKFDSDDMNNIIMSKVN